MLVDAGDEAADVRFGRFVVSVGARELPSDGDIVDCVADGAAVAEEAVVVVTACRATSSIERFALIPLVDSPLARW